MPLAGFHRKGLTSGILIPPESYGMFSELLMALYIVTPGANANDVIPVFSGRPMFATVIGTRLYPHKTLP